MTHGPDYAVRRSVLLLGIGLLVIAAILTMTFLQSREYQGRDEADESRAAQQREALIKSLDATREQLLRLGVEPVAPDPEQVLANPTAPIAEPPKVSAERLTDAARMVLEEMLPAAVEAEAESKVDSYVGLCVGSGDCVGPPGEQGPQGEVGPAGEPGVEPSPSDITAAVLTVCSTTLDCEVTDAEIAEAVAAYCSGAGEPCGTRWTFEQIFEIAIKAAGSMRVSCPADDDVPDDQPYDCIIH